jgi:hypothetical protein
VVKEITVGPQLPNVVHLVVAVAPGASVVTEPALEVQRVPVAPQVMAFSIRSTSQEPHRNILLRVALVVDLPQLDQLAVRVELPLEHRVLQILDLVAVVAVEEQDLPFLVMADLVSLFSDTSQRLSQSLPIQPMPISTLA